MKSFLHFSMRNESINRYFNVQTKANWARRRRSFLNSNYFSIFRFEKIFTILLPRRQRILVDFLVKHFAIVLSIRARCINIGGGGVKKVSK